MPDVADKCIAANTLKFAGIVCSTNVLGRSSKLSYDYENIKAMTPSGLTAKLDTRLDDKTYYSN